MSLSYSGPIDVVQSLVALYRSSVPADVANDTRKLDEAYLFAAVFAAVEAACQNWSRNTAISTAVSAALDALATNLGLRRQFEESDSTFRSRMQQPPAGGTAAAILAAAQAIVTASGGPAESVFLIQLPLQGAIYGEARQGYSGGPAIAWYGCPIMVDGNPADLPRVGYPKRAHFFSGGVTRMVIVLIPASANCQAGVQDALRTVVSAAKQYAVETYTG